MRGEVEPSLDGRTYFAIIDDNGGACGPMTLDGEIWPHPIDAPRPIEPGTHRVQCGGEGGVEFDVPEGAVFKFDYWRP